MRRENLIVAGCLTFCVVTTGIGLSYQRQNIQQRDVIKQQQCQISSLRESNDRLNDTNLLLKGELKTTQEQLDLVKSQMDALIANGGWSMHKGIATAYSPLDNRSGIEAEADGRHTSIGLHPGDGIIAVDPKRIPYHSQVIVIYSDGTVYKGIAGDTGGALRNDDDYHVDIYKRTFNEAEAHGVKNVIILWKPEAAK